MIKINGFMNPEPLSFDTFGISDDRINEMFCGIDSVSDNDVCEWILHGNAYEKMLECVGETNEKERIWIRYVADYFEYTLPIIYN